MTTGEVGDAKVYISLVSSKARVLPLVVRQLT